MKYSIYIFIALLFSCDVTHRKPSFKIPEWLIGNWNNISSESYFLSYSIDKNNIKLYDLEGVDTDYLDLLLSRKDELIINYSNDTLYSCTIRSELDLPVVDPDYTMEFTRYEENGFKLTIPTFSCEEETFYRD